MESSIDARFAVDKPCCNEMMALLDMQIIVPISTNAYGVDCRCSGSVLANATFCPYCGAKFEARETA